MAETKKTRKPLSTPIDSTYGHLQPQALDIEKVVLGALMIDKDAFSVISEIIRPKASENIQCRADAQYERASCRHYDGN